MPAASEHPEPRADLRHSHQRHRQQPRRLAGQAGVVVDDVGDHGGTLGGDPLDVLAHGRLAGQVGLEDEAEGAVLGRRRRCRTRPSRRRRAVLLSWVARQRAAAVVDDLVAGDVEQREVEVELAGEVLVEHRLGHARPLGDVVHRGGVVALRDEHLERGVEQLGAPLPAREPAAPGLLVRRPHGGTLLARRARPDDGRATASPRDGREHGGCAACCHRCTGFLETHRSTTCPTRRWSSPQTS